MSSTIKEALIKKFKKMEQFLFISLA